MIAGLFAGLQARLVLFGAAIGLVALAVLGVYRSGRKSASADAMKEAVDVQRKQLDAAVNRPRTRDDLAKRLRDGTF